MKLTKKAQEMMDILEDAFADIDFANPVALLTYEDREAKITQEIFNYNYGEKEGPKSPEATEEHKILKDFLKNIPSSWRACFSMSSSPSGCILEFIKF